MALETRVFQAANSEIW